MAIKTLFKTIEEVQEYISIDISGNISTILPYIKQAEKFTTDIIGAALHADLLNFVQNGGAKPKLEVLLPYVQLPLINFAYMIGGAKLSVNIGDTGISTTESQNLTPIKESRLKSLIKTFANSGYDGLEDLLQFLEANKDDYPKWKQSKAYSYNKKFFVNNAEEMNSAIFIGIKRYDFLKLKPFIHQIEQSKILPSICNRFFNQLKTEILSGNISNHNSLIINSYIRPAVCYLAMDKYKRNENFELEGRRYLEQLSDFLNENADNYFYFKSSSCYEDPGTAEDINTEDSGLFVFGRP